MVVSTFVSIILFVNSFLDLVNEDGALREAAFQLPLTPTRWVMSRFQTPAELRDIFSNNLRGTHEVGDAGILAIESFLQTPTSRLLLRT